jgi:hypothetical protein
MMEYTGIVALIVALMTTSVWFHKAWKLSLPESAHGFQTFWIASLLLGFSSWNAGAGSAGMWALGISVLLLLLTLTGKQKIAKESIGIGDTFPNFSITTDNKMVFDSSDLSGSRVLIKFFRAHW